MRNHAVTFVTLLPILILDGRMHREATLHDTVHRSSPNIIIHISHLHQEKKSNVIIVVQTIDSSFDFE